MRFTRLVPFAAVLVTLFPVAAMAQSFGVELHNTVMPAAGAMGGVSVAMPQDLVSAINANPATLTQFQGTQFNFGGAWAEPTFNLTQTNVIPVVGPPLIAPYAAKSTAPGAPIGNIGVTQDFNELGMPVTVGLGFVTSAGGAVDFRQMPESRGTNSGITVFNMPASVGVSVTDRLSFGATASLGIAMFDGPFVGASGMTSDYALRGTLGANYLLTDNTTAGGYYQTEQAFQFDNGFIVNPGPLQNAFDVRMALPQNLGFGIANTSLMEGCLLVGMDVIYKYWDQASLFDAVYDNQLVVQLGTQLTRGRVRFRAGYAWAENPIDPTPGGNVGGVPLAELRAVRYTQGLLAITSQNRISAGIGIVDILPGMDMDLVAGGMLRDTEALGDATVISIESYWIGTAITWRFGRGSSQHLGVPEYWTG